MITLLYGPPGSGKTSASVVIACRELKKGRTVYSNFPIIYTTGFGKFKKTYSSQLINIEWLKTYKFDDNSLLLFDEIDDFLESRGYSNPVQNALIMGIKQSIKKSRHMLCDIIIISQSYSRIDKILRDSTNAFRKMVAIRTILPRFAFSIINKKLKVQMYFPIKKFLAIERYEEMDLEKPIPLNNKLRKEMVKNGMLNIDHRIIKIKPKKKYYNAYDTYFYSFQFVGRELAPAVPWKDINMDSFKEEFLTKLQDRENILASSKKR